MELRILHISDLHVAHGRPRAGLGLGAYWRRLRAGGLHRRADLGFLRSHDPDVLEAVAHLAWQLGTARAIDMIAVTGDIATHGRPEDQALARTFIDGRADGSLPWLTSIRPHPLISEMPTLAGAGVPVVVVPGNHDRYTLPIGLPRNSHFDREFGIAGTWGPLWDGADCQYRLVRANGLVAAVVAADFSLRHALDASVFPPLAYLGEGRAYPDILRRLHGQTAALLNHQSRPDLVVWLVHFAPDFPFPAGRGWWLGFHDGDKVLQAAASLGVDALLTGHTHRALRYPAGSGTVHCAGTASQLGAAEQWVHVLALHPKRGARVLDSYKWAGHAFQARVC